MTSRTLTSIRIAVAVCLVMSISATPAFAGTVSGTVYDADTLAPLPGIRVRAFDLNEVWSGDTTHTLDATLTAADGSYLLDVPAVGALVSYSDPDGVFRDMYVGGQGLPPWACGGIRADFNPTDVDAYLYALATLDAFKAVRVAGSTRYTTSVAISKANFYQADTVVIASGEAFPDGLSASPLAGGYRGPLLLTTPASLPASVTAEIQRLGATQAFIVGGTGAVSAAVETQLKGMLGAGNVHRVSGATRYATAVAVAEYMYANFAAYTPGPFVVRGDAFPDALSASSYAYNQVRPILLSAQSAAPAELLDFVTRHPELGADESPAQFAYWYLVVGGTGAVSDDVLIDMAGASQNVDDQGDSYIVYDRIAGSDRFGTSLAVAEYWGLPYDTIGLANGFNFPDALSGGAAAGSHAGALLLTPAAGLSSLASSFITDNSPYLWPVQGFGGTGVIADATLVQAANANGAPKFDHDTYYAAADIPWFGAGMAPAVAPQPGSALRASAPPQVTQPGATTPRVEAPANASAQRAEAH